MAWCFHDFQDGHYRAVSALFAIRELCTKQNVNEGEALVATQSIIQNRALPSSILRVVELAGQLAKAKTVSERH